MQMRKDLSTKILMVALFKMKKYPPKPRVPITGLYKLLYTHNVMLGNCEKVMV